MNKKYSWYFILISMFWLQACEPKVLHTARVFVSEVEHTAVKRQTIGNCWIYAFATWFESVMKAATGHEINSSESYWTYRDFYEKLSRGARLDEQGEFDTAGGWNSAKRLILKYGWIREADFQVEDEDVNQRSSLQQCALLKVKEAVSAGGKLFDVSLRTEASIREVLDDAFSCSGHFPLDWAAIDGKLQKAQDTLLPEPFSPEARSLAAVIQSWHEVQNPLYGEPRSLGKGLPSDKSRQGLRRLEQRIKRALNDHQPVVLAFFVSFQAPDANGLFNLDTLADAGYLGMTGGHMLVLHDYTVADAPGFGELGEGDLGDAEKAAAIEGQLQTLVAKNSWGTDRWDRPWLGDGYSRITWDYLSSRYYDEKIGYFLPFLQSVILPSAY